MGKIDNSQSGVVERPPGPREHWQFQVTEKLLRESIRQDFVYYAGTRMTCRYRHGQKGGKDQLEKSYDHLDDWASDTDKSVIERNCE